jgi:hypothetical protein
LIFTVLPPRSSIPHGHDTFYLVSDRWDDFSFKTQFFLTYRDTEGLKHDIGTVKIAKFGMGEERGTTTLDDSFERLDNQYFSLGQDADYYENLAELGVETRDAILQALRDVASDLQLFRRARHEQVMRRSLLRFVSATTVENQLNRVARGGARLSAFTFTYRYPRRVAVNDVRSLEFEVSPYQHPPTNVHVIIGRNGVGKSLLLNSITTILVRPQTRNRGTVEFLSPEEDPLTRGPRSTYSEFANVVSIAFSAFDDFTPINVDSQSTSPGSLYTYVGLKDTGSSSADKEGANLKSSKALASDFSRSVTNCVAAGKLRLWREALEMLESDPIFADAQVAAIASSTSEDNRAITSEAEQVYSGFSSGHKIVLLTMTRPGRDYTRALPSSNRRARITSSSSVAFRIYTGTLESAD